jgi:hypothetical protein
MKETLEIKKEAAIKAHENAKPRGKKLLENLLGKKTFLKNVTERIKTFEDVLSELQDSDPDVIEYRKLQQANVADYIIANQEAILISKVINESWTPNWDNSNEYKYFPWFKMGSSGFRSDDYGLWPSCSSVGSRLCFKTSELARYAGEQFTDVYEKFMLIK